MRDFIECGAIRYLQFDSTRAAGFTESLRVAQFAEQYGVFVVPHHVARDPRASRRRVARVGYCVEIARLGRRDPLRHHLTRAASRCATATSISSDKPGFGIEIDWKAVERYRSACCNGCEDSAHEDCQQHNRYDYSPLTERKDYSWPGGKRLAFCITTNIECFAFGKGRGHDNAKHGEPQTQRNYSWRDYGNRIGIWRLFDLADELEMPLAHNTNSLLYDYAPQIFERIRSRGDEIVGARPHQLGEPARLPLGGRRSARDPRGDRDVRAQRRQAARKAGWARAPTRIRGRPIC